MSRLIDLSQPIDEHMPTYPGDPPTKLVKIKSVEDDEYTNFQLKTGMHSGTHLDGPMHLTGRNKLISEFPPESFYGEGCILDVRGESVISMKDEYLSRIKKNCILLLYTGHDQKYGTSEYYHKHPEVHPQLAEFIISQKTKILGMDLPSPDPPPFNVHKLLLTNNIFIIENLTNLDKLLQASRFEVMAFPLKINADSSILRVVAKIIE